MENFPKYILKKSKDSEFIWILCNSNKEVILTSSETYSSKQNALNSIVSSKKNIADMNFKRKNSTLGQPYFLQVAMNGEELGKSQMYRTIQDREEEIDAVKKNAVIARIDDLTSYFSKNI